VSFCGVSFLATPFPDFGRMLSCSLTCYQVKPSLEPPSRKGLVLGNRFLAHSVATTESGVSRTRFGVSGKPFTVLSLLSGFR
jgi:hypothetical protein